MDFMIPTGIRLDLIDGLLYSIRSKNLFNRAKTPSWIEYANDYDERPTCGDPSWRYCRGEDRSRFA